MRRFWIALFALFILGLAVAPSIFSPDESADEELLILSPHWDGIKHEFGSAFAIEYEKRFRRSIRVTWLDQGATSEIRRFLDGRLKSVGPSEGVGADILFGGGVDMLPQFAERGLFETYALSPEQQRDMPLENFGQPLRDPQSRWFGACLATFGFVCNEQVLQRANLPRPERWSDLARPEYQGWVSCGNPAQSGSLHAAFELVLQGHGWDEGSGILLRMSANVRSFNEGGASIPRDVSLGQAAVGPSIDFYATAPMRRQGADHLKLVVPKGQALATPDGIAILRNPPNRRAATAFLDFVFSEAGQRLWYQSRGSSGGPQKYDLERLPVMPRIYESGLPTHVAINPFKDKPDFQYDSKKAGARWTVLEDIWRATIIDVHDDLWTTRAAVSAAKREDLDRELGRPPFSEAVAQKLGAARLTADSRNALRNKWSAWARARYAALRNAAETKGAVPEWKSAE